MAVRPIFVVTESSPFVKTIPTSFSWHSGLSISQKRKNIHALHYAFLLEHPEYSEVLEISTKSLSNLGNSLSAFNLTKYVVSEKMHRPVECLYQGSKVFPNGGPCVDLYNTTPKEAKKDPRLAIHPVCEYCFEGNRYPATPKTAFYDWLYINALFEHDDLAKQLVSYSAFTDIEFNPQKGSNCQAHAAAMFVSLYKKELLHRCHDFQDYLKVVTE